MTNPSTDMTDQSQASDELGVAPRPQARNVRGFLDKRGTILAIERQLIETVSKVYEILWLCPLNDACV